MALGAGDCNELLGTRTPIKDGFNGTGVYAPSFGEAFSPRSPTVRVCGSGKMSAGAKSVG